jgi:hypothetical protein
MVCVLLKGVSMKKGLAFLVVGLLVLSGCGKGSGGRKDLKAAMETNVGIMETFCQDMEKAGNADQVIAAMNTYTRELEKLIPRMKTLQETYPEFSKGEFPEEIKEYEEKLAALGMKMMGAMMKTMQYGENPKVMAAHEKMMAVSEQLGTD